MRNFIFLLCFGFNLLGCSTQKIAGDYAFETECLEIEMDGSQTVKAWGSGPNVSDAIEQAKKNAVRDVLFKGRMAGKQDCQVGPLITEVNAQKKHVDYFNSFFSHNGSYRLFVSSLNERIGHKIRIQRLRSTEGVTCGVTIRIIRPELKSQLKKDGIIKNYK